MTKAEEEKTVERIVSHDKGVYGVDENGARKLYTKGEKVTLRATTAANLARRGYVEAPEVASAKAKVAEEEVKAAEAASKAAEAKRPPLSAGSGATGKGPSNAPTGGDSKS